MQVDLILTSANLSDKKLNTTISYVNPSASNEKLRSLASELNALTTNRYEKVVKQTKEEL